MAPVGTYDAKVFGSFGKATADPREELEKFFESPWLFYFEYELSDLSGILEANGMLEWSRVPKIYFIFRELGCQYLISSIIKQGLSDPSLPLDRDKLVSDEIGLNSDLLEKFEFSQRKVVQQSQDAYEEYLSSYFDPTRDFERNPLDEIDFQQISRLLLVLGKQTASKDPKLYYVLRTIGEENSLAEFQSRLYSDMWFPFPGYVLRPPLISNANSKAAFLRTQDQVCSQRWYEDSHLTFSHEGGDFLQLKKELGSGGTGQVDHVYCPSLRRSYARKLLLRTEGLRLFANELKVLKSVNHRHCVSLISTYTDPYHLAILTRPVADMNLGALLEAASVPADRKELLGVIFGCLSTAISYLHSKSIRHKDIKPQNILIHGNDVYLTDFGISADSSATTSMVHNTVRYNSPEFEDGHSRDEASDIWSLGCVFFEILACLQKQSITKVKEYFRGTGTKRESFHANPEAIKSWLTEQCSDTQLGMFGSMTLAAKELTSQMLNPDKSLRPSPNVLVSRLGNALPRVSSRYGRCCRDELEVAAGSKPSISALSINFAQRFTINSNESTRNPALSTHQTEETGKVSEADTEEGVNQNDGPIVDRPLRTPESIVPQNESDVMHLSSGRPQGTSFGDNAVKVVTKRHQEIGSEAPYKTLNVISMSTEKKGLDKSVVKRREWEHDLKEASIRGDLSTAQILLNAVGKSDLKWSNSLSFETLAGAAAAGHAPIVRLLLQFGADPKAVHPGTGKTAYHSVSKHVSEETMSLLRPSQAEKHSNGVGILPPTSQIIGVAIAIYTFEAQAPGDLGFQKGDIIAILKRSGNKFDWWSGMTCFTWGKSQLGILPGNYVQIVHESKNITLELALATYTFDTKLAGNLPFKKGDPVMVLEKPEPGWWLGFLQTDQQGGFRKGTFPSNYIGRSNPPLPPS